VRVFYYGAWGGPGHYLRRPSGMDASAEDRVALPPELVCPDGVYCGDPALLDTRDRRHPFWPGEEKNQPLGLARLVRVTGNRGTWTALSFWDRSQDKRFGSNSTFIAEGDLDFAAMCVIAAERFPGVWRRITAAFPVVDSGARVEVLSAA
jgi:hypothetical protein